MLDSMDGKMGASFPVVLPLKRVTQEAESHHQEIGFIQGMWEIDLNNYQDPILL